MEAFVVIAAIGVGLLLAELLLPTGGVLALLGVVGLTAAGVVAFNSDSDLVGAAAEARSSIDPEGRVWLGGTIWSARLAEGASPIGLGDRVRVEAVDGLTLVVRPEPQTAVDSSEGVG
jgi:inner membrane protein